MCSLRAGEALTLEGLKLTFLAVPCSSPETAGWLLKPCFTFRAVSSSCRREGEVHLGPEDSSLCHCAHPGLGTSCPPLEGSMS